MTQDYTELIQQVTSLLQSGQGAKAVEKLAPICQKEVPFRVNRLYVEALLDQQQYAQAYAEAVNYERNYLQDAQAFPLWLEILIQNGLFIPARLAVNTQPQGNQKNFLTKIQNAEKTVEEQQSATVHQKLKNFYHIGDCSEWEQQQVLNDSDHLPMKEYVQGAQFILRDPFTNQLIRNAVIHTLADLGYSEAVKLIWLDKQEYSVVPASIQTSGIIHETEHLLEKRLENNPTELQNLSRILKVQFLCLYPFVSKVVTDPVAWIEVLTGSISEDSDQIRHAQKWQKMIQTSLT